MNDLSINEGKPYHDHCLLQNIRSRIAFLSDKMGRRSATVLDAEELQDLLFVETRVKNDIETHTNLKLNNDKPVFFRNTPFGKHSAMNSPGWKKILAKKGTLEGTKYHMHKTPTPPEPTTEPIWQITTDESGHKRVIQIGTRPVQILAETKKEELCEEQTSLAVQNKDPVDYEAERIKVGVWRGFELLDKLIPNSNILDLNARVAALNRERNQQICLEAAA